MPKCTRASCCLAQEAIVFLSLWRQRVDIGSVVVAVFGGVVILVMLWWLLGADLYQSELKRQSEEKHKGDDEG